MDKKFEHIQAYADKIGSVLVKTFHLLALFAIGGATVWSAVDAFLDMVKAGRADVGDLLLLFIYLELGAMVGIYFKTNKMPVRFLIYVAMTALTRLMIEIISKDHSADTSILVITGAILILAIAEFILRYGSVKFPIARGPEEMADRPEKHSSRQASTKT